MSETRSRRLLIRIGLCLFLIGIPLLAVRFMILATIDTRREIVRERDRRTLENDLWRITRDVQPRRQIDRLGRLFKDRLARYGFTPQGVARAQFDVQLDTGMVFDVYCHAATGPLVWTDRESEVREVLGEIWKVIAQGEVWERLDFRARAEALMGFSFAPEEIIGFPDTPVAITGQRGNGFVYWSKMDLGGGSGFILAVMDVPPVSALLKRLQGVLSGVTIAGNSLVIEEAGKTVKIATAPMAKVTASFLSGITVKSVP